MSAFAPGPWVTDPELGHEMVLDANGVLVADCSIIHRRRTTSQCVAHAALIAAAPELYAELQNIAHADPSTWLPETRDQFREWAQSRARAALAKAQGAQS